MIQRPSPGSLGGNEERWEMCASRGYVIERGVGANRPPGAPPVQLALCFSTHTEMFSPVARGVAAAGVAATGIALSDRDRRDAVAGVANGSIRFVRAFGWGAAVSFDYKYRCVM